MVIVNTVVIVQGGFGLTDQHTAMAFAAFGAGSMLAALALPALLKRWKDRSVMLAGAWVLLGGLGAAWFADSLYMLMPVWALLVQPNSDWPSMGLLTVMLNLLPRENHFGIVPQISDRGILITVKCIPHKRSIQSHPISL